VHGERAGGKEGKKGAMEGGADEMVGSWRGMKEKGGILNPYKDEKQKKKKKKTSKIGQAKEGVYRRACYPGLRRRLPAMILPITLRKKRERS